MSAPMRIDWPALLERMSIAGKLPGDTCFLCLTEAGRQLVIAMIDRLQWRATYRVEGYDYSDWDALQGYVEDTIGTLAMANCEDIVNQIVTQVTQSVTYNMQQITAYTDACCYLETNPPNIPPPSDVPPPSTGGARDVLCVQAQIGHDGGYDFLEQVFLFMEAGGGLTAAIIGLLLGGVTLPLALLALFIGFLVAIFTDLNTDEVLEVWEGMKEEVVCAIVNAASAEGAKTAVDGVIDALIIPQVVKDAFKILYSQSAINQIWEGTLVDPGGYSPTYCQECTEWANIGGLAVTVVSEDGNKYVGFGNTVSGGYMVSFLQELSPTPPYTFCFVKTGLEAHYIGDENLSGALDDTPATPTIGVGTHSGNAGSGIEYVTFSNFRLLVSTAAAPDTWFWIAARLDNATGVPNIEGEFEVTPGIGEEGVVDFIGITFSGNAEFYYKNVNVTPA